MPARMTISAITIISSMRVNPARLRTDAPAKRRAREPTHDLPVTVLGAVERSRTALGKHVEHVLPAPRRRVRLVLVRPQAPLHAVGHRVDRNPPQVFELAAGRVVGRRHALDERLEIRRIAFVVGLQLRRRNLPDVDGVLELVDRHPDLAQFAAELHFALPLRRHLRQRQHRRREDQQDRDDDDQLDEGVAFELLQRILLGSWPLEVGSSPEHVRYLTFTAGAGATCSEAPPPPGAVAVPVTERLAAPAPTASNSTAASSPVPETPVASPARTIAMSMRPVTGSTICVKAACAPPARMKLPSWTARTRTAAGLNVIVNDSPDSRDAFVAEMATVYGPPPTRNSGPGGVMTTCAPAGAIVGGGAVAAAGAAGTGAGVVGEGAGTGAPEAAPPGSAAAPGTAGVGAAVTAVVPGTGELPGGMIDTPGAVAAPTGAGVGTTGGAGAATGAPKAGSGSSGAAISGGGPFRPRFCCVPM